MNRTNSLVVTISRPSIGGEFESRDIKTFPRTRKTEALEWAERMRPSWVWDKRTRELIGIFAKEDTDEMDDEGGSPENG